MNAELALWLVEQGIDVSTARSVAAAATSPADIALALLDAGLYDSVQAARDRASEAPLGVPDIAPRLSREPARVQTIIDRVEPKGVLEHDDAEHAFRVYAPVVGPDGLTDGQRAAVQTGVGLCRNCQQPKTHHLPGCALHSGEDPKAVTKSPLPPAV